MTATFRQSGRGSGSGCTPPSQPSTRSPKPETRNPKPETPNPQPSTLNPQPSTLQVCLSTECGFVTYTNRVRGAWWTHGARNLLNPAVSTQSQIPVSGFNSIQKWLHVPVSTLLNPKSSHPARRLAHHLPLHLRLPPLQVRQRHVHF